MGTTPYRTKCKGRNPQGMTTPGEYGIYEYTPRRIERSRNIVQYLYQKKYYKIIIYTQRFLVKVIIHIVETEVSIEYSTTSVVRNILRANEMVV